MAGGSPLHPDTPHGWRRVVACFSLASALGVLPGCPNPNAYTVPRTLDPGDLQIGVADDVYGFTTKLTTPATATSPALTQTANGVTPMLPSVIGRYGLADGLDVGFRLANFFALGGDLKVRLLRGSVDLAVDPGTELMYVTTTGAASSPSANTAGVFYLHAPLLVGINLSDIVSLVATPGVAYAIATNPIPGASHAEQAGDSTQLLARLGFGADFRLTRHFAIHPELTCMKGFTSTETFLCVGGVAFISGAQPDYSDLAPPGSQP